MTKRILLTTAVALILLPFPATAQDRTNPDDGQKTYESQKPLTFTGTISSTGQTFVRDHPNTRNWTITNPEAVKGYEGKHVTLTANVDADKVELHIVSVIASANTPSK